MHRHSHRDESDYDDGSWGWNRNGPQSRHGNEPYSHNDKRNTRRFAQDDGHEARRLPRPPPQEGNSYNHYGPAPNSHYERQPFEREPPNHYNEGGGWSHHRHHYSENSRWEDVRRDQGQHLYPQDGRYQHSRFNAPPAPYREKRHIPNNDSHWNHASQGHPRGAEHGLPSDFRKDHYAGEHPHHQQHQQRHHYESQWRQQGPPPPPRPQDWNVAPNGRRLRPDHDTRRRNGDWDRSNNHNSNTMMRDHASAVSNKKGRWSRAEKRDRATRINTGDAILPDDDAPDKTGSERVDQPNFQASCLSCARDALARSVLGVHIQETEESQEPCLLHIVVSSSQEEPLPPTVDTTTIRIRPLLILDLNGVLCHRRRSRDVAAPGTRYRSHAHSVSGTPIVLRTDLAPFLQMLQTHFTLAVWTSATLKTVKQLLPILIPDEIASRLLFVWGQDKCDMQRSGGRTAATTKWTRDTVYVKSVHKVWEQFPLWDASNTLLLDDSLEKCPWEYRTNTIHPPSINGQMCAPPQEGDGNNQETAAEENDESNQERQGDFFRALAEFWSTATTIPCRKESKVTLDPTDSLYRFLLEKGTGHMGWRGAGSQDDDAKEMASR